jgi:hypothetical protein
VGVWCNLLAYALATCYSTDSIMCTLTCRRVHDLLLDESCMTSSYSTAGSRLVNYTMKPLLVMHSTPWEPAFIKWFITYCVVVWHNDPENHKIRIPFISSIWKLGYIFVYNL